MLIDCWHALVSRVGRALCSLSLPRVYCMPPRSRYAAMTVAQLKQEMAQRGQAVRAKSSKKDLVQALENYDASGERHVLGSCASQPVSTEEVRGIVVQAVEALVSFMKFRSDEALSALRASGGGFSKLTGPSLEIVTKCIVRILYLRCSSVYI